MTERSVPTADEVRAWEIAYQQRYRAQHRARNEAFERAFTDEVSAMRVDHAVAYVEGTLAAAESLVSDDHDMIARARGHGWAAARDGDPDREMSNPTDYENFDEFMAWHAGYLQGQPLAVDRNPATRPRGYTPPSGYVCPLCDAPEGRHHTGPKRILTSNFGRGGPQEACEDHLIVRRMPVQRPGKTFT